MSEQFSPASLRRVWDNRTRRGQNLNSMFPEVEQIHFKMREQSKSFRSALRRCVAGTEDEKVLMAQQSAELDILRKQRDECLANALELVSSRILDSVRDNSFGWKITTGPLVKGKQTYTTPTDCPESFFAAKEVETDLRKAFDVRLTNRNVASEQLLLLLRESTKKLVVRSDFKSFYESIPHQRLLGYIKGESQISRLTVKYVERLLSEFRTISGLDAGLPRGLGVSSVLAEIYMQKIDEEYAKLPGLIAYLRYVDDIVLIFSTGVHLPDDTYRQKSIRQIAKNNQLRLNPSKTKYVRVPTGDKCEKISFLGYQFKIADKTVDVDMTLNRMKKYRDRIERSFDVYDRSSRDPRAESALSQRIEFLTSNLRLTNNKRQALVGIYYSNSLLTGSTARIEQLDRYLKLKLKTVSLSQNSSQRMKEYSFTEGFEQRTFKRYSPTRLYDIVKVWKYE